MDLSTRRYYIDNLRWIMLMILIPNHAAQAWNTWNEPNYIFFESNKIISGIIVFFSPFFIPLLFLLAGISTKFALNKRTVREYIKERGKKLLIPLAFGTLILMPIMTYIADKYNFSYKGSFIEHYSIFFTKYTDLIGADGGFSFGQFWFLLYLFPISLLSIGIISLIKKCNFKLKKEIPFRLVLIMGLPLPIFSNILSVAGKNFVEFTYLFLLGYFIFSDDEIIKKAENKLCIISVIGVISSILNVYLFLWTDNEYTVLNTIFNYSSKWFMIVALIAFSGKFLNFSSTSSRFMAKRSFIYFIWHFIWVVVSQYVLYGFFGNQTIILFIGTILLSVLMTFICTEITLRIPILCFLTGTKYIAKNKNSI